MIMTVHFNRAIKITLAILTVGLTAFISSVFVQTDTEWFNSLVKPDFYPPPIVFSVVWSVIYVILAFVLAKLLLIKASRRTIVLYIMQLVLQILWSLVFFTLEMSVVGLLILLAMVILTNIVTILLFNVDELSGWLYFVVFVWIVFACMLNYGIVMLN